LPDYLTRLNKFENENFRPRDGVRAKQKLRDKFFMSHFKVLQKRFGSYYARRKAEDYFHRIYQPDLNDQKDNRFFSLFKNVGIFFGYRWTALALFRIGYSALPIVLLISIEVPRHAASVVFRLYLFTDLII
jgi:hypothetical protein